jgi:hypothetical protein
MPQCPSVELLVLQNIGIDIEGILYTYAKNFDFLLLVRKLQVVELRCFEEWD